LIIAVSVILFISALRFTVEVRTTWQICCWDFPIFWQAVEQSINGKPLYRLDSLSLYDPGSSVYKFPPSYAALLVLPVRYSSIRSVLLWHVTLQIIGFWVSALLLVRGLRMATWKRLLFLIVALNFGPFFETLRALQVELPILLGFVLAAYFLKQK